MTTLRLLPTKTSISLGDQELMLLPGTKECQLIRLDLTKDIEKSESLIGLENKSIQSSKTSVAISHRLAIFKRSANF